MSGSVLFLTHTTPLPLVSGERIRYFHVIRELARRGWRVSLFSLLFGPEPSAADRRVLEELCETVDLAPFRPSPVGRYARVLRNVVTRRAFHADFFADAAAGARFRDRIDGGRFDAIVVGTLYMYGYVPAPQHRISLLDSLNVETRRVEAMAATLSRSPRGIAARLQRGPVERYEREAAGSVARVVAVSEEERAYFERLAPGRVDLVPNGVDCEAYGLRDELPREPTLLFLGSMDYSANVDAAGYLVREILPLVRTPGVEVTLVGSNPRRAVFAAARGAAHSVEVTGQVESTRPYFEQARLFVVPLRYGGGTRLKILEALAQGVPVISTSVGCEGLGLRHEHDVVVADEPAGFAAWIDRLLEDDELCRSLAREGRKTVEERYDWRTIGGEFERALRKIPAT